MEGEHEPAFSFPNGKCPNGLLKVIVERERKSPAPKWQCLLYGVLNVVQSILLIILICTYIGGNQTGCREQGETPITEKPEGPPRHPCVPCSMLPPRLREKNKTQCCITEDLPLKKLVTVYVDSAMASRFQPDEARVRVPDFHASMTETASNKSILAWEMPPDGPKNSTHLKIEKSGYYFVSADVSFNFTKREMLTVEEASFRIMHLEKATNKSSRLFLSHSVPICAKDKDRSDCFVPNEVGGIRPLEEGDQLFVETDRPGAVCSKSTSFGFQMISE